MRLSYCSVGLLSALGHLVGAAPTIKPLAEQLRDALGTAPPTQYVAAPSAVAAKLQFMENHHLTTPMLETVAPSVAAARLQSFKAHHTVVPVLQPPDPTAMASNLASLKVQDVEFPTLEPSEPIVTTANMESLKMHRVQWPSLVPRSYPIVATPLVTTSATLPSVLARENPMDPKQTSPTGSPLSAVPTSSIFYTYTPGMDNWRIHGRDVSTATPTPAQASQAPQNPAVDPSHIPEIIPSAGLGPLKEFIDRDDGNISAFLADKKLYRRDDSDDVLIGKEVELLMSDLLNNYDILMQRTCLCYTTIGQRTSAAVAQTWGYQNRHIEKTWWYSATMGPTLGEPWWRKGIFRIMTNQQKDWTDVYVADWFNTNNVDGNFTKDPDRVEMCISPFFYETSRWMSFQGQRVAYEWDSHYIADLTSPENQGRTEYCQNSCAQFGEDYNQGFAQHDYKWYFIPRMEFRSIDDKMCGGFTHNKLAHGLP